MSAHHADSAATVLGQDYADGDIIHTHCHAEAQLLFGLTGLTMVETVEGAWLMPPEYGLWIPPMTPHAVRMMGQVAMRNLYLTPGEKDDLPPRCEVLEITRLVRELMAAAGDASSRSPRRDVALLQLLLIEIPRLRKVPLFVPMPSETRLRRYCQRFLAAPSARATIEQWCTALDMSRRTFTRRFRQETGLSFIDWRQRACVMAAIPRLLKGTSITRIAFDLEYDNPAAFSSMFKRICGIPPGRYRESR